MVKKVRWLNVTVIFFLVFIFHHCKKERAAGEMVIHLNNGWRFITGDSGAYKNPQFNDQDWKGIKVDKIWESQGFDPYDGYAWYRISIKLPSSLKDSSYLKRYLRISLGKINNFDQSFINGKIFGINGLNVGENTQLDDSFIKGETRLWD